MGNVAVDYVRTGARFCAMLMRKHCDYFHDNDR